VNDQSAGVAFNELWHEAPLAELERNHVRAFFWSLRNRSTEGIVRFTPIRQVFLSALDGLCTFMQRRYSLLPNLGVTGSNPVGVTKTINDLSKYKVIESALGAIPVRSGASELRS